jgi:predicted RNase H-like nuclease (RuvC/YqgF family)
MLHGKGRQEKEGTC